MILYSGLLFLGHSVHTGWLKRVSHYQINKKKIVSNCIISLSLRLDLFVKLKYESSTINYNTICWI